MTKERVLSRHLVERFFQEDHLQSFSDWFLSHELVSAVLHSIEGSLERLAAKAYALNDLDLETVIKQMGAPPGWYPLLPDHDHIPELPESFDEVVRDSLTSIVNHVRVQLEPRDLAALKARLRDIYESNTDRAADLGSGEQLEDLDEEEEDAEAMVASSFSVPEETALEIASRSLQIHPISVYWLLREGFKEEGWKSKQLERQFHEDRVTTLVLRILGHRWPHQVDAGEELPSWADRDGIIPLSGGTGRPSTEGRIRDRLANDFGFDSPNKIEREFRDATGKSIREWICFEFFRRHISQFKKRPIAWQIESKPTGNGKRQNRRSARKPPAFACLVYYGRVNADLLPKLRTQYVGPLRTSLQTELTGLDRLISRTVDQDARRLELEETLEELREFDARLEHVISEGFSSTTLDELSRKEPLDIWTSRTGRTPAPGSRDAFIAQERRFDPDLNDGVRVNIAPLQRAGLLAADVLAPKDVEKAIGDRAAWRADERRWCREGKLPRPGWWLEDFAEVKTHAGRRKATMASTEGGT